MYFNAVLIRHQYPETMIKKIIRVSAIVLLSLFLLAFAAPFIFKGKITRLIKRQINEQVRANVDFSGVDLSLFRHFPKLAIGLDSLRIVGTGEFAADTLLYAKKIEIAVNLYGLISKKELNVRSLSIDHPRIHAIVHKNGHANWDITKNQKAESSSTSGHFRLSLNKYKITDGFVSYTDEANHRYSELYGINHSGSGDFTDEMFTLKTKTQIESIDMRYGAISYLHKTRLRADLDFDVNNRESKYSFKSAEINLNDFVLKTDGWFLFMNDSSYAMDIRFSTPANDFKNVLSLIPAVYQRDFNSIKTSGEATCNGSIKGRYDAKHLPAYHINLDVRNGFFQYADLPKPVQHINLSMNVENADGITDHTVINIPKLHFEMDELPVDGHLLVKTPVSDPFIDAGAKGRVDLARITQLVKLENGMHLNGILDAEINAHGNLSAIEKQRWEKFIATGSLSLSDFMYASNAYPDGIRISSMVMNLTPKSISINQLLGEYLKTRFSADGSINNLMAYMFKHEPLSASMHIRADQVNLNDWMASTPVDSSAKVTQVKSSSPFLVPAGIDFQLAASVDKMHYDNLDMQNVSGNMRIVRETLKLNNVRANALDGTITINGSYSTLNNKKKPDISFSYDVKDVDIQKTYYCFNTVQKLMPAGKFISGKFNSQLTMSGQLAENMTADLNSISGDGNLSIADGQLRHFEPLDKLADALAMRQLEEISLKDVKTLYSFRNGRVLINPFNIKSKGVEMRIGGSHGFDQSLDYAISMKIPRSVLGGQVNTVVTKAVKKAGSHGVSVKVNDNVNVNVKMGGTISNPLLTTDLKEAISNTASNLKQQAEDIVQEKVNDAKQQIKDTARVVKQQLVSDAGNIIKNQVGSKDENTAASLDNTKKKATESGKNILKGLWGKKKSN